MSERGIDFDHWPDKSLEEMDIAVDRAHVVHSIIEKWEGKTLPTEVAYSALNLLYYMNAALDNDGTRLYQQDMMQRFAFNAMLDTDRVVALEEHARSMFEPKN